MAIANCRSACGKTHHPTQRTPANHKPLVSASQGRTAIEDSDDEAAAAAAKSRGRLVRAAVLNDESEEDKDSWPTATPAVPVSFVGPIRFPPASGKPPASGDPQCRPFCMRTRFPG